VFSCTEIKILGSTIIPLTFIPKITLSNLDSRVVCGEELKNIVFVGINEAATA
jgi:hypothetical protein